MTMSSTPLLYGVVLHPLPPLLATNLSVLGGNFVLGRASVALAWLGDGGVTELIASVISNLVEGEILQAKEVKMEEKGKGESIMNEHVHNEFALKTCTSGKMDTSR